MEESTLQRRLQKALVVAEKLKRKGLFEKEVNKELGRRNELLKKTITAYEEKMQNISKTMFELEELVSTLSKDPAGNYPRRFSNIIIL